MVVVVVVRVVDIIAAATLIFMCQHTLCEFTLYATQRTRWKESEIEIETVSGHVPIARTHTHDWLVSSDSVQ